MYYRSSCTSVRRHRGLSWYMSWVSLKWRMKRERQISQSQTVPPASLHSSFLRKANFLATSESKRTKSFLSVCLIGDSSDFLSISSSVSWTSVFGLLCCSTLLDLLFNFVTIFTTFFILLHLGSRLGCSVLLLSSLFSSISNFVIKSSQSWKSRCSSSSRISSFWSNSFPCLWLRLSALVSVSDTSRPDKLAIPWWGMW